MGKKKDAVIELIKICFSEDERETKFSQTMLIPESTLSHQGRHGLDSDWPRGKSDQAAAGEDAHGHLHRLVQGGEKHVAQRAHHRFALR